MRFTAKLEDGRAAVTRDDAADAGNGAPARVEGRGAYLHESQECLERAVKTRAFQRALRIPGGIAAELPVDGQPRAGSGAGLKASNGM